MRRSVNFLGRFNRVGRAFQSNSTEYNMRTGDLTRECFFRFFFSFIIPRAIFTACPNTLILFKTFFRERRPTQKETQHFFPNVNDKFYSNLALFFIISLHISRRYPRERDMSILNTRTQRQIQTLFKL